MQGQELREPEPGLQRPGLQLLVALLQQEHVQHARQGQQREQGDLQEPLTQGRAMDLAGAFPLRQALVAPQKQSPQGRPGRL